MEAFRFETEVGREGVVRLPDVQEGDRVELIVLRLSPKSTPRRTRGWMKGYMTVGPDFDDPIPGLEEYQ